MKYILEDILSDFEFHDAKLTFGTFQNDCLKVNCNYLNIHKNSVQNPFDTDMEIDTAQITFEGFKVISYEVGRGWQVDENGAHYTNDPQIILYDSEATYRFLEQLKYGMVIFDFDIKDIKEEQKIYFIDAVANDPFFTVCFTFDKIIITWDNYKKESWYEKRD